MATVRSPRLLRLLALHVLCDRPSAEVVLSATTFQILINCAQMYVDIQYRETSIHTYVFKHLAVFKQLYVCIRDSDCLLTVASLSCFYRAS